jgi:hypothetical protein
VNELELVEIISNFKTPHSLKQILFIFNQLTIYVFMVVQFQPKLEENVYMKHIGRPDWKKGTLSVTQINVVLLLLH